MPQKPSGSQTYRNHSVQDDDDDLDDLDDVLASFNAPASKPSGGPSQPSPAVSASASKSAVRKPSDFTSPDDDDEDFEASLAEGMESLLRQLATAHPPGPMPDLPEGEAASASGSKGVPHPTANARNGEPGALSPEEEEAAWQRAVEMMLSGEGLSALGLDQSGSGSGSGKARSNPEAGGSGPKPTFDETIRKTMESLKTAGSKGAGATGYGGGDGPDLADLLKKLSTDPGALDGLGDGDDDDLGGLLDGMMSQLMTREVLEEPMAELASKYPPYLANPPSGVSPTDLEKYKQQHILVDRILDTFRRPGYSDEKDGKEVARLVGEMQDLGGPPKEIMGDLPEGFDLGALGGEEGCTIM